MRRSLYRQTYPSSGWSLRKLEQYGVDFCIFIGLFSNLPFFDYFSTCPRILVALFQNCVLWTVWFSFFNMYFTWHLVRARTRLAGCARLQNWAAAWAPYLFYFIGCLTLCIIYKYSKHWKSVKHFQSGILRCLAKVCMLKDVSERKRIFKNVLISIECTIIRRKIKLSFPEIVFSFNCEFDKGRFNANGSCFYY